MKVTNGWAFPDADRFMVGEMGPGGTYQLAHLEAALRHVTDFSCAIDGGAHVGTWSRLMAGRFDRVLAFEPSADTCECLAWNMTAAGCHNVEVHRSALGQGQGRVTMALDAANAQRANTGARFARAGGAIPVVTIDSFKLDRLGFLKLDIEGSEPAALRGAAETIATCHPIILFENKRLWTRHFGMPKDAVARVLEGHRYQHLESISCDQIWGPR
jgi:FkbM family methyltransferase